MLCHFVPSALPSGLTMPCTLPAPICQCPESSNGSPRLFHYGRISCGSQPLSMSVIATRRTDTEHYGTFPLGTSGQDVTSIQGHREVCIKCPKVLIQLQRKAATQEINHLPKAENYSITVFYFFCSV